MRAYWRKSWAVSFQNPCWRSSAFLVKSEAEQEGVAGVVVSRVLSGKV